jgi:dTDP-4-amino-4,6-dideoxygalactose transaminase
MQLYRSRLSEVAGVRLLSHAPAASCAHHLNVVRVSDREQVRQALARRHIGTGVHYPVPCHLQPAFSESAKRLPIAESAAGELLTLPLFPHLDEARVHEVCDGVARAVAAIGKRDRKTRARDGDHAA